MCVWGSLWNTVLSWDILKRKMFETIINPLSSNHATKPSGLSMRHGTTAHSVCADLAELMKYTKGRKGHCSAPLIWAFRQKPQKPLLSKTWFSGLMKQRLKLLNLIPSMFEGNQMPPHPLTSTIPTGKHGGGSIFRVKEKLIWVKYRDIINENLVQGVQDLE